MKKHLIAFFLALLFTIYNIDIKVVNAEQESYSWYPEFVAEQYANTDSNILSLKDNIPLYFEDWSSYSEEYLNKELCKQVFDYLNSETIEFNFRDYIDLWDYYNLYCQNN